MDVQVLAAWGELVGGVAGMIAAAGVIATLLYLAHQVRQNTKSLRSSAYAAVMAGNAAVHETHMQAADVLADYFVGRAHAWGFDSVQYIKFHGHATQVFHNLELAFLLHQDGIVDDEYFESRMRLLRRALQFPGFSRWWREWAPDFYHARFVEFGNVIVRELDCENRKIHASQNT